MLPQLSVGAGFETGNYPFSGQSGRLGTNRSVLQVLARYTLRADAWQVAPFVDLGRALAFRGSRRGHGVSLGIGLDILLGHNMSFIVEGRSHVLWPGDAVDDRGRKFRGIDQLSELVGIGLEINLQPTPVPPSIQSIDVSPASDGTITFNVSVNSDAVSRPVDYHWTLADEATASGPSPTHTFRTPGPHKVTVTASNSAGEATESVYVLSNVPTQSPRITTLNASPNPASVGEAIQFTSRIDGATVDSYRWRFGDGDQSIVKAPSHRYSEPGTYTVELTASAQDEEFRRTVDVTVRSSRRTVVGRITRSGSNTTVPNVEVRATPIDVDSTLGTDRTNPDGLYAIPGLPSEQMTVRARKPGFHPEQDTITLTRADSLQLDLSLSRRPAATASEEEPQSKSEYTLIVGRFRDSTNARALVRIGERSNRDLVVQKNAGSNPPTYDVLAEEDETRSPAAYRSEIYEEIIRASSTELYTVQHGIFGNPRNAEKLIQTLHQKGHATYGQSTERNGRTLTRVRTGLFLDQDTAEQQASRLQNEAPAAVVTRAGS